MLERTPQTFASVVARMAHLEKRTRSAAAEMQRGALKETIDGAPRRVPEHRALLLIRPAGS